MIIQPQPGPQMEFLNTVADIAIYGGSAGSGKSFAATMEPLRHLNNSEFGSITFRRTSPEITAEGGLWHEAGKIYPAFGARPNQNFLTWTFPSGMSAGYAHLQHLKHIYAWQGAQVPLFIFDELTHFEKLQFFYMLTRNRSMSGVPGYMRATCNPDADSWVAELIAWWIDQNTGYPLQERSGRLRWFIRVGEVLKWGDSFEEACSYHPNPKQAIELRMAKSLTFIPATIHDNPIMMRENPQYMANLLMQDLVTRERLLAGNWKIRPSAGKIFNRGWFKPIGVAPKGGVMCRFWDLAASVKKMDKDDPDFTAGVLIQLTLNGDIIIHDSIAELMSPAEVNTTMKNVSWQDYMYAKRHGCTYMVRWEEEGGASGKRDSYALFKLLAGLDCKGERPDGDKITRAKPLAAQALAGNVAILNGPWNERYLQHMHNQPEWSHDDEMDGSSGAYNALIKVRPVSGATSDETALHKAAKVSSVIGAR